MGPKGSNLVRFLIIKKKKKKECDILGSRHVADSCSNSSRSRENYILYGHGYTLHGGKFPL